MNILITNDDGIQAEGLNILAEVLSQYYLVWIIAPDRERSACSNAITVRSKLIVKKIAEKEFSVKGYPADCVNIGLHSGLIPEIDLVLSGINHGPNVGDDLFFSGTVAGARTAYVFNKTGIAVSINSHDPDRKYLKDASLFIKDFIDEISSEIKPAVSRDADVKNKYKPLLFNINYPNLPRKRIKGKVLTYTGKRIYQDSYDREEKKESEEINLWLNGNIDSVRADGSDATELSQGYISITPLSLDCTDYSYINAKSKEKSYVRS